MINSVTLGQRYEYLDPLFLRHLDILEKNFRALSNSGALVIFPFLRHLPGDLFEFKRMKRDLKGVFDDYTDIIHEHRCSKVAIFQGKSISSKWGVSDIEKIQMIDENISPSTEIA